REQLRGVLAAIDDEGEKERLTALMLEDYRRRLCDKKEAYPKGESIIFRLNNANFNRLYEERVESRHYSAPAKYLKALLEEYARLSPAERERIYFADVIDETLQPAVDAGYVLEIVSGKRTFLVRPYAVAADAYSAHMYLIGLSRPKEDPADENETIASFRVSRLHQVRVRRRHGFGKLTVDDKRDIEKKLHAVGVQYLIGDMDEIRVRLSERGRHEFLQRSYMRPQPVAVEGDVYAFRCTSRQIKNYFISFGKDAEVLSPASLREEFIETYREAAAQYTE
ncbi:MAG: WYL domain-containing protein, partial [Clostridia bacterium]|nr:WYL domain-containing protein [Clostridia bacterium]